MPETVAKLQPHRTMHLRGFDRRGAAAALVEAGATGFTMCGVFRDQADFAVLTVWDADCFFEHHSMRYLPDFDLAGLVLTFDVAYEGLHWIESRKFPSIDWPFLDFLRATGEPGRVRLSDHITTRTGRTTATASWTVAGTAAPFDRVTLWVQNTAFDVIVPGVRSATFGFFNYHGTGHVHRLVLGSTTYTYTQQATDSSGAVALGIATAAAGDPNFLLTVTAHEVTVSAQADSGAALVANAPDDNAAVTLWVAANPTHVVAAELRRQINATVWGPDAPVALTAAGTGAVVEVRGNAGTHGAASDANGVRLIARNKTATLTLTPAGAQALAGGTDPTVRVSLDFSALGLSQVRQLWLTFAPRVPVGAAYATTEWEATVTNWAVSDAQGKRPLQVAGPGSVRVGSRDAWVAYEGAGWAEQDANNLYRGFARVSKTAGDRVTVRYHCQQPHDLYVGTSLYRDRGIVAVRLDGDAATDLDCFLNAEPAVVTRRRVRTSVPAGEHTVTLTLSGRKHAAQALWDAAATDTTFVFDFLEAAVVAGTLPEPVPGDAQVTAAIDYDTDHTYKVAPARLVWSLDRLGLHGQVNEYVGVFWWNQRRRKGGSFGQATVTFGGTWGDQGVAWLQFGGTVQGDPLGTRLGKTCFPGDTPATIAEHFAHFVNSLLVGVWASAAAGVLTLTTHSPTYDFTLFAWVDGSGGPVGTVTKAGDLHARDEGVWEIDDTVTPVVNAPTRRWHEDLYALVAAQGWGAAAAFSMELVNPPEATGAVWAARFWDNTPVATDTGFSSLKSTHCSFVPAVLAYQKAAYREMADLMAAAGLTPWLQFGEFLWWFFDWYRDAQGTRVEAGLAFYDGDTKAAAAAVLGRPLARFHHTTDDPASAQADADFLRGRIKAHMDAIRAHVLAGHPTAKFELLFAYDVNYPAANRFGIGGALNRHVNLPAGCEAKATSGLDRLKMEALSFGAQERHGDKARETMQFPVTGGRSWPRADTAYLVPIFNGGCPWPAELRAARHAGVPLVVFWAYDHICLMSWPVPFPDAGGTAGVV